MKEVLQIIENFVIDRPVILQNNLDPEQVVRLLIAEVNEWKQETDPKLKARELADIVWFALTMGILSGVDIEAEIREKASRNMCKRPASDWQTGNYSEIDARTRKNWAQSKGDEEFYSL
jgi:hypothetical protein